MANRIDVDCPHCDEEISLPVKLVETEIECPYCQERFVAKERPRRAQRRARRYEQEFAFKKPTRTALGHGFGGGFGWVMGIFLAFVCILIITCGGCVFLAAIGKNTDKQNPQQQQFPRTR